MAWDDSRCRWHCDRTLIQTDTFAMLWYDIYSILNGVLILWYPTIASLSASKFQSTVPENPTRSRPTRFTYRFSLTLLSSELYTWASKSSCSHIRWQIIPIRCRAWIAFALYTYLAATVVENSQEQHQQWINKPHFIFAKKKKKKNNSLVFGGFTPLL